MCWRAVIFTIKVFFASLAWRIWRICRTWLPGTWLEGSRGNWSHDQRNAHNCRPSIPLIIVIIIISIVGLNHRHCLETLTEARSFHRTHPQPTGLHINKHSQMHHCTSDMQCTQNYLSIVCVLKTFGYCTGLVSLVSPVHILHFRHYLIIETLSIFISKFWHVPTMMGFCHGGNMPASHDNDIIDDNNVYLTWSFHEGSCAIRATPFLDVRFLHFQVQLHHGRRSIPAKSGSV